MLNWLRIVPIIVGALVFLGSNVSTATQSQLRRVYISALDRNTPMPDLERTDFEVKVDGRSVKVVDLRRAESPLKVAVIVSDHGTGLFRADVQTFVERLIPRAQVAMFRTSDPPEPLADYTTDIRALTSAVEKLGRRGARGSALLYSIASVARETHPKGTRRAIVAISNGDEVTELPADYVRQQLRASGATLYVVSGLAPQRLTQIGGADVMLRSYGGTIDVNQALEDGARESGGRYEQVVFSDTVLPTLERLAGELLNQYVVDVTVPPETRADAKLSITPTRKGLTICHASRISPAL